jgi:ribulose-phosphate 3-epimerase
MIHIAPSILAADFAKLGDEVRAVDAGGCDRIHIDVMDGHFVPNLSMGAEVVEALRPVTKKTLEVHVMIDDPVKYAPAFFKAGADSIIFHLEVLPEPTAFIESVKKQGKRIGISIKPDMPVARFEPWLAHIDTALLMTVFPGFGGQAFLPESPERIRMLRKMIQAKNPKCELEIDGGVHLQNVESTVADGADVLVIGTGIFHHKGGPTAAMAELKRMFG